MKLLTQKEFNAALSLYVPRETSVETLDVSKYPNLNLASTLDPTRTTGIRLAFVRDVNKRLQALKSDVRISIIDRDCFGIIPKLSGLSATSYRQFDFPTSQAKVEGFLGWLTAQEEQGILEIVRRPGIGESPWSNVYIDSSYQKGIRRAQADLRRNGYPAVEMGTMPGGMRTYLAQPFHAERIAAIYSRTFEDLKSVTDVMNAQVRRQIADGLTTGLARGMAEGKAPLTIARELYKDTANRIDKIGITRCRMVARTEVIRAHHVANMGEYEHAEQIMGEEIWLDWLLGGNPCEICEALAADGPYPRAEFPDLPAHPRGTCCARPVKRPKEPSEKARRVIPAV